IERGLEVVDVLEGEVEPRGDTAEHEVRDLVERLFARDGQSDLVARHSASDSNAGTPAKVSLGSIVPAPTTAPSSDRTAAWPGATPYAGWSSWSLKPPSIGSTRAPTAGER